MLLVTVCQQHYTVTIDEVVEVAAMVESARLSEETHPAVHGVIVRRGLPLVLIDLRVLFYCTDAPVSLNTLFVVVKHHKELVGFIVDHVEGVVYLNLDDVRPVRGGYGFVRGVLAHNHLLVQWLSASAVVAGTLPAEM